MLSSQLLTCLCTDSIDLQDQNAPSAQDHTRQPSHPAPRGAGPPAPHQAEALREVAAEAAEQNYRSPRVSKEWTNGDVQQMQQYGDDLAAGVTSKLTGANLQQQDDLAVAQNGGLTGSTAEDAEMADAEGDDGMDDDMMDKISSSPSIDDGGYSLPHLWPQRSDSLSRTPTRPRSASQACSESSSPFVVTPDHFPLRPPPEPIDKDAIQGSQGKKYRHLLGEYLDGTRSESNYEDDATEDLSYLVTDHTKGHVEAYEEDFDLREFSDDLLAQQIDMLNQDSDDQNSEIVHDFEDDVHKPWSEHYRPFQEEVESDDDAQKDNSDEPKLQPSFNRNPEDEEPGIITIPYESSEDEDDDDIPYSTDSRFVDSGWGGECLQDSEDIDFEFVYALHTFVATVEGQANATKGDTMVLLDDSNSYWWLVRVVKDSSIG